MQSCSTARAQFTRGSTVEKDCELNDEVVDAVDAAEGEVGGKAGLLHREKFPSKLNIVASGAGKRAAFSFLDEAKVEVPLAAPRVGVGLCGENANTLEPESGALISVSSLTSGRKCVLRVATTLVLARLLDMTVEEDLLVLLLSFLAAGRLLFPMDHEISDEAARFSSREENTNVDEADDAPRDDFLLGPSRRPRLESDGAAAFFLAGTAAALERDDVVLEKNLGDEELPPASGEVDQFTSDEDEAADSSLGVLVARFCHRTPSAGEGVAGLLLLLLLR
jgi:hypothetical protein